MQYQHLSWPFCPPKHCYYIASLASLPGSTQLSFACSTNPFPLFHTGSDKSWAELGNEAIVSEKWVEYKQHWEMQYQCCSQLAICPLKHCYYIASQHFPKSFLCNNHNYVVIMTLQLGDMTYHYHTTQYSHPQTKFFGCPVKMESGYFQQKNWSQFTYGDQSLQVLITYQQCKFWYKKSASWLPVVVYKCNLLYLSNIRLVRQLTDMLYNQVLVFPVNVSRSNF